MKNNLFESTYKKLLTQDVHWTFEFIPYKPIIPDIIKLKQELIQNKSQIIQILNNQKDITFKTENFTISFSNFFLSDMFFEFKFSCTENNSTTPFLICRKTFKPKTMNLEEDYEDTFTQILGAYIEDYIQEYKELYDKIYY